MVPLTLGTKMKTRTRFILGVVLVVFVILLHLFGRHWFPTLASLQQQRAYFMGLVEQRYFFAVCSYLFIFVVASSVGIPITILLTIAAGYFFGVVPGVLYATAGATAGAAISFLAYRYVLGGFVQQRYAERLMVVNKNIARYGHNYLLTLQLLPVTPTFVINILAGLTTLPLWTFVWTTWVGIFPGSLLYTIAGRQLTSLTSVYDLLSWQMMILLALLAVFSFLPVLIVHNRK